MVGGELVAFGVSWRRWADVKVVYKIVVISAKYRIGKIGFCGRNIIGTKCPAGLGPYGPTDGPYGLFQQKLIYNSLSIIPHNIYCSSK